jgi:multidrug efflux pump subunit AcrB
VVRTGEGGAIVRLKDVADVKDKWSEDPNKFFFNGKRAVNIDINKTNDQDMFSIADRVRAYMDKFDFKHNDIEISLLRDGSGVVKERANILSNNGILGIILVVMFLSFSLNPRLAFWVALAIPFSFAGMALLGTMYGLTINVVSLMGMIIVIGMLVDDGIVIAENIYQHYEKGEKPIEAAINGTLEVLPSVTAAILTTIVFFTMFLFLEGDIGLRMKDIGFVVILTLAISLVEGVLILPAHIAHSKALHQKEAKKSWILRKSEAFLHLQRDIIYAPILKFSIRNPFIVAIIPVALFMITIGAIQGSVVKLTFFPVIERDNITLSFQMPAGTPESVTDSLLTKMEQDVWQVSREYENEKDPEKSIIKAVARAIGPNAHQGGLRITLVESQFRDVSEMDIRNMIREQIGEIPQADRLQLGSGGMWGMPVSVALKSSNLDQLHEAKEELKTALKENPRLKDVTDNDSPGLKEVKIKLNENAFALGLTTKQVMDQVRSAFFGKEAQRILRGIDEVKIWVRYDKTNRTSLEQMEDLRIRLNDGRAFPLREVADFSIERGVSAINHIDAQRVIEVDADIVSAKESVTDIVADVRANVMPAIVAAHPDVTFDFEGQSRESGKTGGSIQSVIPIIFGVMFVVVVFTFRSFLQAFIVFIMVPFCLIGVVWGHFIQGFILSLFSMFGTIALIGIVINNALIFINEFNRTLKRGVVFNDALFEAGMSRFRPVILTSMTTIAGLGPLMFETSRQAQFLSPMAVSVAYGLLFGTTLTLIMLPSLLVLFNRLKVYVLWLIKGEKPSHESVEPAVREEVFASNN